ncbi:hypothetical protein [Mangrovicoccus algicola]|uniref:Outer membrane protein beta-barrel domain-containing protein n=1 Tax=Mangrovicoccus algicola TaxID=2771008 RepID=A0A8J7CU62_9RHOB|nr:hypothetical protein [Mangrovicoccus algicola]MBE3637094.1 hypothetical protein [Mangrovicoccus algicola]
MRYLAACGLALAAAAGPVAAQQAPGIETEIGIYGFGVAIGGDASAGGAEMDIDLPFGDVWDALEGLVLAYAEHRRGNWIYFARAEYMDLDGFEAETSRGPVSVEARAGMAQWTVQGFAGYRVTDRATQAGRLTADLLGGLRYVSIDMDVDASLAAFGRETRRDFGKRVEFTDPVVALRAKHVWNDAWGLAGWIDLGGFGAGSEFSTSAEITIDRQWSNGWRAFGGWKYFTFDYEDGPLEMQPTYSGPVLGVSYRF